MSFLSKLLLQCCFALSLAAVAIAQENKPLTLTAPPDKTAAIKAEMEPKATAAAHSLVDNHALHPNDQLQLSLGSTIVAYYVALTKATAQKPFTAASVAADTARTDKQLGASASSNAGSTSVVDRPGIAQLLGFAVEHGAVTQNIQGNTVTFSSSPYAIAAWLGGGDTAENYQKYGNSYGRVGFSANFNLNDTSNPALNATRKQLNEWSAKIRLGADHSGRSKGALNIFETKLQPVLQKVGTEKTSILNAIFGSSPELSNITNEVLKKIPPLLEASFTRDNQIAAVSKTIVDATFEELQHVTLSADTQQSIATFVEQFERDSAARVLASKDLDSAIADLAKRPSFSLAYLQEQPAIGKNYSVFKFVYEQSTGPQISANVSASLYHHPDRTLNQDTFRDFTASVEFLQKIARSPFFHDPNNKDSMSFSLNGRYERMPENQGIKGKKADIAVAGAKFEIPVGAGVTLPISVTYANATELIKEAHVNGNFGITFDLDKLKQLVSK